jgi:GTPase SAR1 family protein
MPTIGVEYKQKIIEVDDKSLIKVQIWDTAGT